MVAPIPAGRRRRWRFGALSAVLLLLALVAGTGCSAQSEAVPAPRSGVGLVHPGRLTTCTHLPYAPFQFTRGNRIVGFDVAMIDLVAKRLGVRQTVLDTSFETIKSGAALNARQCDIAAAGMTITPDRQQHLDFSVPYFNDTQALLARGGVRASTPAGVRAQGLRLGSQSATTGEDYAVAHDGDPVSYEGSDSELDALRTRGVDVIIQDYPVVAEWLKNPADRARFHVAANLRTGEQYGFAVKKGGNAKLLAVIDQVIKQAEADGTYRRLYEQWIGPMPKEAMPR
jgi:polar amino acid transport system substrate-binding protein